MLDFDLASLYDVETKRLKEAVKRNLKRFPSDFMFELSPDELQNLRSQFASSSWGGRRHPPFAFTEHGVTALANVLNSDKAIEMGIAVVRAFIALRQIAITNGRFTVQLEELRQLLEQRIDEQDVQLTAIYDTLENLLNKKIEEEEMITQWKNRDRIGYKSPPPT